MSDIQLLRQAAALMRDRAKGATPGPWYDATAGRVRALPDHAVVAITPVDSIADNDGAHIASWHPAVALAIANWLDSSAFLQENDQGCDPDAIAVAAAYLGESK